MPHGMLKKLGFIEMPVFAKNNGFYVELVGEEICCMMKKINPFTYRVFNIKR